MNRNSRGFLLFEVVISIVLITAGLLFIMRSYSSSKNSIQRSTEVFRTSLLLEGKMWEFEEKGLIEEGSKEGDFAENEEYSWQAEVIRMEDSNLNQVTLAVFRKKDRKDTEYFISTYLKNKTE